MAENKDISSKFLIHASAWVSAMRTVSKAVINKPVLPVLENICVRIEGDVLFAEAGDTAIWVAACRDLVEGGYEGTFLIPAKLATAPFVDLGDTVLTFSVEEGSSIVAEWYGGMVSLPVLGKDDWPGMPSVEAAASLSAKMPSGDLSTALSMTDYAADKSEVRPALAGVLFEIYGGDGGMCLVATDAHRLVVTTLRHGGGKAAFTANVPRRAAQMLRALLTLGETVTMTMSQDGYMASFRLRDDGFLTMTTRLVEGKYPAWRSVIPANPTISVDIPVFELAPAVARAAACTDSQGHVRLSLDKDIMAITAQDLGFQTYGEMEVPCPYDGPHFEIGVKAAHLAETMEKMPSRKLRFSFTDATRSILVQSADEEADTRSVHTMSIVMPVMIS